METKLFFVWVTILILWFIFFAYFRVKINQVPFGILPFGLYLVVVRLGTWGFHQLTKPKISLPKIEKSQVNKISDLISAYQLRATEVILGMKGNVPIRTDLLDKHTLLVASTGGGKSYLIHSILIQLFGKNSQFTDNVDVYLVDLKGHPRDMLHLWKPLLAGYAQRGRMGDISEVIDLLRKIDATLQLEVDKRVLVIIEEGSILVRDKEGDQLLGNIASQLRLNGSLLVTIQHPVATIMNTFIKHNIERRICGVVMNRDQAQLALEVRPKESELPEKPGEYLIKEPGKRHLIQFEAMMPNLPEEIETIVQHGIETQSERDERLRIFKEVAINKKKGASITGAQTLAKDNSFSWLNNAQFQLMVAYRNFSKAGVFIPPEKQGSRNKLAVDFEEGFAIVKKYIEDGKWEREAEKVI